MYTLISPCGTWTTSGTKALLFLELNTYLEKFVFHFGEIIDVALISPGLNQSFSSVCDSGGFTPLAVRHTPSHTFGTVPPPRLTASELDALK